MTKFLVHLIHSMRLFWPSVAPILISYIILVYLDQGQDILISLFEKYFALVMIFPLIAAIWSGLLWYPSRLISQVKDRFELPTNWKIFFPRLIGFNAIVALHTAIFTLPQIFNKIPWGHVKDNTLGWCAFGYLAFYNILFVCVSIYYAGMNSRKARRIQFFLLLIIGSAPWILFRYFALKDNQLHWISNAVAVALILVLIQSAAFIFQLWRREIITKNRTTSEKTMWLVRAQIQRNLLPESVAKEPKSYLIFVIIAALGLFLFSCAWLSVTAAKCLGPLITTLISLALISTMFSFVKSVTIQKSIPILWIYCIILIAVACFFLCPDRSAIATEARSKESRPEAINALQARLEAIAGASSDGDSTAYIILADGGGARSGYWTTLVLNELNKQLEGKLPQKILMMSSTSGGTIGNGIFFSQMNNVNNVAPSEHSKTIEHHCEQFFKGDFLSHLLASMLVPDLTGISVLRGHNRGHSLVDAMSDHAEKENLNFQQFNLLTQPAGAKDPLVFFNTCSMINGTPGVLSNVQFGDLSTYRIDVLKSDCDLCYDISYVDAMILSSRFPFVSPAGQVGNQYYVDGGYFDNTGAAIVADVLYNGLKNNEVQELLRKIKLRIVHITNDPVEDSIPRRHYRFPQEPVAPTSYIEKMNKDLVSNYAAPIATVLGTYSSQTGESNSQFFRMLNDTATFTADYYQVNLFDQHYLQNKTNIDENKYLEGYPMSWNISNHSMDLMKKAIHKESIQLIIQGIH